MLLFLPLSKLCICQAQKLFTFLWPAVDFKTLYVIKFLSKHVM